ncbi:MAG: hypothetical protein E6I80_20345 [Chloroflexi bacterium]|nr:MAG: hypothetical protein E6I80_20345 [Chloroflexota bacterium]
MMGTKERAFAPIVAVSLEVLVPTDHFYRQLQRTLDLSFVREFVQESLSEEKTSRGPVSRRKIQRRCHCRPRSRPKRMRN